MIGRAHGGRREPHPCSDTMHVGDGVVVVVGDVEDVVVDVVVEDVKKKKKN